MKVFKINNTVVLTADYSQSLQNQLLSDSEQQCKTSDLTYCKILF